MALQVSEADSEPEEVLARARTGDAVSFEGGRDTAPTVSRTLHVGLGIPDIDKLQTWSFPALDYTDEQLVGATVLMFGEPFYPQNHVGRGWGTRSGAMGAVRLPNILVLTIDGFLSAQGAMGLLAKAMFLFLL